MAEANNSVHPLPAYKCGLGHYFLVYLSLNCSIEVHGYVSRTDCRTSSHTMKVDNTSSIERVEEFKYLGTTLTNQNSIQEEMKRR